MATDSTYLKNINKQMLAYSLPGAFANYCTEGRWKYGKHHELIEEKLLDVANGKCKRLIISAPPRAGKSMLTSHYFPAWFLGRFPNKHIILASYESTFAATWGRKARDALIEFGSEVFDVKVAESPSSIDNWEIACSGGGMVTAGAGGSLTGRGASLIIAEDLIKNSEEAQSLNTQEKIWDWFSSTLYTRLTPDGSIVIVMTRWSENDVIGRIIKNMQEGGEQWEVLNLPAIADSEDDPLGRKIGEALWPEMGFDVAKYEQIRQQLGLYWFSSLYQGKPSSKEGNLIKLKWFNRYKTPPSEPEMVILSLDTAQKANEITDYTVIQTWYLYKNSYYLIDNKREKMDHPRLLSVTKDIIKYKKPHVVLIEERGSGISLCQHLESETSANIIKVVPTLDKITRMSVETPAMESGRVYLPDSAPWLFDFEEELRGWPKSAYKDQIDATSQFLKWARERESSSIDFW